MERLSDAARKSIALQDIVSPRVPRERLLGCVDVEVVFILANT